MDLTAIVGLAAAGFMTAKALAEFIAHEEATIGLNASPRHRWWLVRTDRKAQWLAFAYVGTGLGTLYLFLQQTA